MARIQNIKRQPSGLRHLRETLGRTQEEFAKDYGIPLRTLQDWEKRSFCPEELGNELALQFGIRKDSLSASDGIARNLSNNPISKAMIDSWKKALELNAFGPEYDHYVVALISAVLHAAHRKNCLGRVLIDLSHAVEMIVDKHRLRTESELSIEELTRKEFPVESISIESLNGIIKNFPKWTAFKDAHEPTDLCELRRVTVFEYRPIAVGSWNEDSQEYLIGELRQRQELNMISSKKRSFTHIDHLHTQEIIGADARKRFNVDLRSQIGNLFLSPELRNSFDTIDNDDTNSDDHPNDDHDTEAHLASSKATKKGSKKQPPKKKPPEKKSSPFTTLRSRGKKTSGEI